MGQEIVRFVADRIKDEELHAAFLATTAVNSLFPVNR
jgi:hypothetical protein